jgi:hypothetical protein
MKCGRLARIARLAALTLACAAAYAQVNVLTANGDNNRTSANQQESQLRPSTVAPGLFGKLGSFPVDGQVYAQPLYVSKLKMPDGKAHSVLFVFTMHNSVFAFDADTPSTAGLLWQTNLGTSVPASMLFTKYSDIWPEIGILSTGVIDLQHGVLYAVAETLMNGGPTFYLHALDVTTGQETMNGPVAIAASVAGIGGGSTANQMITFDASQHMQRSGLLLANNAVYVAFGAHADESPWHGWVISYDFSDLSMQTGVFVTTPSGDGGGIWQAGRGLPADDAGNVYAITGNGDFDGAKDFSETFVKLSGRSAKLTGWYTPDYWQVLSDGDADLSAGPALIPGTHMVLGGDKYGELYLINGDVMGGLSSNTSAGQIFTGAVFGGMFNLAVWGRADGTYVYAQGQGDVIKSYWISRDWKISAASAGVTNADTPRVGMAFSSNGASDGILWETTGNFQAASTPGTLHAFDALDLTKELWNSDLNSPQDSLGSFSKFANPTIANGKVYVPTQSGAVVVYGALCSAAAPSAKLRLPAVTPGLNSATSCGPAPRIVQ